MSYAVGYCSNGHKFRMRTFHTCGYIAPPPHQLPRNPTSWMTKEKVAELGERVAEEGISGIDMERSKRDSALVSLATAKYDATGAVTVECPFCAAPVEIVPFIVNYGLEGAGLNHEVFCEQCESGFRAHAPKSPFDLQKVSTPGLASAPPAGELHFYCSGQDYGVELKSFHEPRELTLAELNHVKPKMYDDAGNSYSTKPAQGEYWTICSDCAAALRGNLARQSQESSARMWRETGQNVSNAGNKLLNYVLGAIAVIAVVVIPVLWPFAIAALVFFAIAALAKGLRK
jgi:hypothetical protein